MQINFAQILNRFGERTAVIDDRGRRYSYRQLRDMAADFCEAIAPLERALVLVRTRNTIESLVGYLGALVGNHVILPVDHSVDKCLIDRLVEAYRPDFIWGEAPSAIAPVFSQGTYALVPTGYRQSVPPHSDLRAVLLTSGSTGSPKGVRLSDKNIQANAVAIIRYLEIDETERAITSLPMSYSYGLSVINSHLLAGATLLLTTETVMREEFWDFFREYGGTSFSGVPHTYEMLDVLRFHRLDLRSLRYFTQAGGKLPPDMVARYAAEAKRRSARFFVMYGQTEATARIAYLRADTHPTKTDCVGGPIPGGRMYLTEPSGREITQPGVAGDLHYEGANVMLGYARERGDLAKCDELHGRLATGDIASFDAEGHFTIVGRRARFIKLSGIRVDLDAVELSLGAQGLVCACGGQDERLLVAVEGRDLVKQVKQALKRTFHIDPLQVCISEVPEIAKTASGKKVAYEAIFGAKE
jgi:acyl-CoA synthetase (AMP-forming)/AMP-acid ligase II